MAVEKKYVEFAIVLAANSNNPTILNPDFLKYNKIIDESLELRQPPICTEPFSQIAYKNGFAVTSQLDKIIFSASVLESGCVEFKELATIVKKYADVIPHVEYTGVGVNPIFVIELGDGTSAKDYILNNFLRIKGGDAEVFNAGISLGFDLQGDTVCNLKIQSRKVPKDEKQQELIVVNANFHHSLNYNIESKQSQINDTINSYQSDIDFFENKVIKMYFGETE